MDLNKTYDAGIPESILYFCAMTILILLLFRLISRLYSAIREKEVEFWGMEIQQQSNSAGYWTVVAGSILGITLIGGMVLLVMLRPF